MIIGCFIGYMSLVTWNMSFWTIFCALTKTGWKTKIQKLKGAFSGLRQFSATEIPLK